MDVMTLFEQKEELLELGLHAQYVLAKLNGRPCDTLTSIYKQVLPEILITSPRVCILILHCEGDGTPLDYKVKFAYDNSICSASSELQASRRCGCMLPWSMITCLPCVLSGKHLGMMYKCASFM